MDKSPTEVSISTTTLIHRGNEHDDDQEIEGILILIEELMDSVRESVETDCLEASIFLLRDFLDGLTHAGRSRVAIYHQLIKAHLIRYGLYSWIEDIDICVRHLGEDVGHKGRREFMLLCNNSDENPVEVQIPAQLIKACRSSIDIAILNNVVCLATEALETYKSSYSGDKLAPQIAKLRILLGKALVMKYINDEEIIHLDQATQTLQRRGLTCMGNTTLEYVSLKSLEHIGLLRLVEFGDLEAFNRLRDNLRQQAAADEVGENLYEIGTAMVEQAGDLQEGIALLTASLTYRAGAHPRRGAALYELANALVTHFERTGNYEHLQDAIAFHREALDLRRPPHTDRSASLNNLANSLRVRFEHMGAFKDLEESITFHREALDLRRPPHPDCPLSLMSLANSLFTRFLYEGSINDLEESIILHREALDLCGPPHPLHSKSLSNLASSLSARFQHKGAFEDLEECVTLYRGALALFQPPHPFRSGSLHNLAVSLITRFDHKRAFGDLEECIILHREELDLCSPPHPNRSFALESLASALAVRFQRKGVSKDLEECIFLHREALDLRGQSHPARSVAVNNLATSLSIRFEHKGALEDLEECITLRREALDLCQPPHPLRSLSLNNMAESLKARFMHKGIVSDIENALQYFQEAAKYSTGLLLKRFTYSKNWIICAQEHCPALTLDAYKYSIELLPQIASLDLTIQQRQDVLQHSQDIVGNAAKCAIDGGDCDLAIRFLSTGRSIFWSQALQLRTPVDELMITNSVIAEEFLTVSRQLENASYSRDASALSTSAVRDTGTSIRPSLSKLATRRHEIIEEIRMLPGYNDFLLAPSSRSLQSAAKNGPIILLNASKDGCDALVMHGSKHPEHIPLFDICLDELQSLKMLIHDLSSSGVRLSQDRLDTLRKRLGRDMALKDSAHSSEEVFRLILEFLWVKVVQPVVNTIQIEKTDSPTRMWWCPTGLFSSLPVHAAGVYSTENEPLDCIFQYAVSSYITSPQDLLHSDPLRRMQSQSFKVTAIIEPEAANAGALPFTLEELKRIGARVPRQHLIAHVGSTRTPNEIEDIMSSIQQSSFVHFGCHGMQNVKDPLESCLLLSGGRLTMSKLMRECQVPEGALAYLSACETAKGDEIRPDESLNLVQCNTGQWQPTFPRANIFPHSFVRSNLN